MGGRLTSLQSHQPCCHPNTGEILACEHSGNDIFNFSPLLLCVCANLSHTEVCISLVAVDLCSSYEAIRHRQVKEEVENEVRMRDGGQESPHTTKAIHNHTERHTLINDTVQHQMTLIHTLLDQLLQ